MSIHISTVREHLLNTLADLRNLTKPMEIARARAVAEVAGVLVDTARVEVEYLRAIKGNKAGFLATQDDDDSLPAQAGPFDALNGAANAVSRHVLKG